MKRILLALALCLASTGAFAQCNGTFKPGYVCGVGPLEAIQPPHAASASTFFPTAAGPGGSTGQYQINGGGGAFNGITFSGDTLITSAGVVTVQKIQTVPVTATSATTNDVLYYNGTGWIHNALFTLLNTICSATPTTCSTFFGYTSVIWYGADPTGVASSTTAFQSAETAACHTAGGTGWVYIPNVFSGGHYAVGPINATNNSNCKWSGNGPLSLIEPTGQDASGNWLDISGSSERIFQDLSIKYDGTHSVGVLILSMCTGSNCATSGLLKSIVFKNVNINMVTTSAIFYGSGIGNISPSASVVNGGSLYIENSTWTENGNVGNSQPNENAALVLDGLNSRSRTSAYVSAGGGTVIRPVIINTDFVEFNSAGQTGDSAAVFVNVGQMVMIGGEFTCACFYDVVFWSNTEDMMFQDVSFTSANGATNNVNCYMDFGGGSNNIIGLYHPFFSSPVIGYLCTEAGTGANAGGIGQLTVMGQDVGGNSNNVPFITTTSGGCGTFTASNNWLYLANVQMIAGANSIVLCGSIDSQSIFQTQSTTLTVSLPGGATDHGTSNPFR